MEILTETKIQRKPVQISATTESSRELGPCAKELGTRSQLGWRQHSGRGRSVPSGWAARAKGDGKEAGLVPQAERAALRGGALESGPGRRWGLGAPGAAHGLARV